VTKLYVNETNLKEHEDLFRLGKAFPNLVSLTVIDSQVDTLPVDADYSVFSHLNALNISNGGFTSWEQIDNIRRFPALTSLRINGVLFLEVMLRSDMKLFVFQTTHGHCYFTFFTNVVRSADI